MAGTNYTVKSGDTLSAIATANDMTLAELKALNPGLFDDKHNGGNLINVGETVILEGAGTTDVSDTDVVDPEVQAIPRDAKLIKVDNAYRVIWDLGDGLGFAWYDINQEQLVELYGDEYEQYVTETFSNAGSYTAKYQDYYWGNVAEIGLKAENPWQDLKDRLFESFGYISGIDDPEIKRLILQSAFEDWDDTEFLSHYRQTNYFNSLNDSERAWATISEAQRQAAIDKTAAELASYYYAQYGVDPVGGLNNGDIRLAAEQIASGDMSKEEWEFTTSRAASKIPDTPASRDVNSEQQDQGQREVDLENTSNMVENLWKTWMGNSPMPSDFATKWANGIYMNTMSEAELLDRLKALSSQRWGEKPEDLSWEDWAAPTKGQIQQYLELPSLDDGDYLLNDILDKNLAGRDVTLAIKADERYKDTNRFFRDVNSTISGLGKTFGYIA